MQGRRNRPGWSGQNRPTFFSARLGNGCLFYLSHGKDRQIIHRACLISSATRWLFTPTHLQLSFPRYLYILTLIQRYLRSFKAYKWRDCLNHEAAFCYQKFSVNWILLDNPGIWAIQWRVILNIGHWKWSQKPSEAVPEVVNYKILLGEHAPRPPSFACLCMLLHHILT